MGRKLDVKGGKAVKRALVFIVKGITGGTATLSYRLGCAFQEKDYEVFYLKELSNNDQNERMMNDNHFRVITISQKKWKKKIMEIAKNFDSVILFTYIFSYVYVLENIKTKMRKRGIFVNTFLYAALPDCMIIGFRRRKQNGFTFKILNRLNRRYIYALSKNKQVLYQDESVVNRHETFFEMKLIDSDNQIFRIPYQLQSCAEYLKQKDKKIISTMARVDFPFKGYMLGLIDSYVKIRKIIDVELWIIGNGSSMKELEEKVAVLSSEDRSGIKLLGNMKYKDAKEKIAQSTVFIGMGTGLLDASSMYVPSIAVQSQTYECKGKGLFKDYPNNVGFLEESDLHELTDDILKILYAEKEEYQLLCKQSREVVGKYYSIDNFVDRLIRLDNTCTKIDKFTALKHKLCVLMVEAYHSVRKVDWDSFNNN